MHTPSDSAAHEGGLSHRIAGWLTRHPILTLIGAIVLVALAFPGAKHIRANFSYSAFFYENDPSRVEFVSFQKRFGGDETVAVAVHSPSGIFDVDSATLLRELTNEMWKLPDVIRVDSLANFNVIKVDGDAFEVDPVFPIDVELTEAYIAEREADLEAYPAIRGALLSDDGKTAMAIAYLKPQPEGEEREVEVVPNATRALAERIQRTDHELYLFGVPFIADAFKTIAQTDGPKMRLASMVVGCLAIAALFRRLSAMVIAVILVVPSILATIWMSGWIGVEITTLSGGIVQLIIAVSLSVTVHVLSRFLYHSKTGKPRVDAIHASLDENLWPTLLTTLTTAIAFFACITADLKIVGGFGVLGGVGALFCWALTILCSPALLRWTPMFRLQGDEQGAVEHINVATPRARRYIGLLHRYRWALLVVSVLAVVGGLFAGSQARVSTNPLHSMPEDYPLRIANEFGVEELGALTFEIIIETGETDGVKEPELLARVRRLQDWIEAQPGVTATNSIVDILEQLNRTLHGGGADQLKLATDKTEIGQQMFLYTMGLPRGVSLSDRVTIDSDALRISVASRILDSHKHVALTQKTLVEAERLGLDAHITGLGNMFQASSLPIVYSVMRSLIIALFAVALLLGIALRSLPQVLLAMVVNIVPLCVGAITFWAIGRPLDVASVVGFSLALGIAVDDTVHIVVHYVQRRAMGEGAREAFAWVVSHVVPALVTTTSILIGSCSVFMLGTLVETFYFGVLLTTVLASALVTDLTLLPALFLLWDGGEDSDDMRAAPAAPSPA